VTVSLGFTQSRQTAPNERAARRPRRLFRQHAKSDGAQISQQRTCPSLDWQQGRKRPLSLVEPGHISALDRADVHEDILATTAIRLDEAITFLAIEPLHDCCVICSSFRSYPTLSRQLITRCLAQGDAGIHPDAILATSWLLDPDRGDRGAKIAAEHMLCRFGVTVVLRPGWSILYRLRSADGRTLALIEPSSQADRAFNPTLLAGTHLGVRNLAPKHVGRKETTWNYLKC
jgi:hypothetical protein